MREFYRRTAIKEPRPAFSRELLDRGFDVTGNVLQECSWIAYSRKDDPLAFGYSDRDHLVGFYHTDPGNRWGARDDLADLLNVFPAMYDESVRMVPTLKDWQDMLIGTGVGGVSGAPFGPGFAGVGAVVGSFVAWMDLLGQTNPFTRLGNRQELLRRELAYDEQRLLLGPAAVEKLRES